MKRVLASLASAFTLCLSALPLIPHTYPQSNYLETLNSSPAIVMATTPPAPLDSLEASIQAEVVPTPTPTPQMPARAIAGSKTDWMTAAGIPQSDWQYVDYIVNKEASWNPLAVNPSSGACSLSQALPCSKIPGDWTDPVNALRWQHTYVVSRYGSYHGAYQFHLANSWY